MDETVPPQYGKVFVVGGHMIDAPDREAPRFPPEAEETVTAALDAALGDIGAGDLLITSGARGTDLIAAELGMARGADVELVLPQPVDEFLDGSVRLPGDDSWVHRFRAVAAIARVVDQDELLGPPGEADRYARNNRLLLDRAAEFSEGQPIAVAVWDGREGDGVGGTESFVAGARTRQIDVRVVDLPLRP